MAEFNRKYGGHIGFAAHAHWKGKGTGGRTWDSVGCGATSKELLRARKSLYKAAALSSRGAEGHTQSPGAKDSAFTVNIDNGTFGPSAYLNNSNFLDFGG